MNLVTRILRRAPRRTACGLSLAVAALGSTANAQSTAIDLYYERDLMATAGQRCALFTPALGAALQASAAQARNAALRAGRAISDLDATRAQSQAQARAVACDSPDLTKAADRVRAAFAGWSKVTRVSYPGSAGGWSADRVVYKSQHWLLVETGDRGAAFGVAGAIDAPMALLAVLPEPVGSEPYAARLKFRDTRRDASPWFVRKGAPPLPPANALRTVFAEARAPAEPGLTRGATKAYAFRFPAAAANALAGLDPRERFEVEFLFPGEQVHTATFEVGDFAAGTAFLAMGAR